MSQVHTVAQGECLSRIAANYGFTDYKTIYNHPDNATLRQQRPNPNILRPGDKVVIPDKELGEYPRDTEQKHRFKVHRPEKELRIRLLMLGGEPLANEAYKLEVAGLTNKGQTDSDGLLKEPVPCGASQARLFLEGFVLDLNFGYLNPAAKGDIDDVSGAQARLNNLGYAPGPADGICGPHTSHALALFQADHGLEINGKPNDDTLKKLEEAHGC